MTAIICYSAAIAIQLMCAALIIAMVSDPQPTGLGQWADIGRHAIGRGHQWRHASGCGRRPNVDAFCAWFDAYLPPERDVVFRPLAIGAGPVIDGVIDGSVVAVEDEPAPDQETEPEEGPGPFDPSAPQSELCGAAA